MNRVLFGRAALSACALTIAASLTAVLAAEGRTAAAPATADPVATLSPVMHVSVDGMSMGYRAGGRGTALVMIIGRGATMAEWDPALIRQLIIGHHVVVFDNRGVATSNNPSHKPVTIQQMARDTLGLMNRLHIARADVLGWSMGGMVAQQVAIDAPRRVLRLVLCATSPGGSHARKPSKRVQKIVDNSDLSTATLLSLSFPPDRAGIRGAISYVLSIATQPDLLPDSFTLAPAARASQEKATARWKAPSGGSYYELGRITAPTLVLWGALDVVEPPYNDRLLVSHIRHARYLVFRNAGHGFLFQDPVAVGTAIRRFLR